MECKACGVEIESVSTAYLTGRRTKSGFCHACARRVEQEDLDETVKATVTVLCNAVNSSVVNPSRLGTALYNAITREHRFLQNELFAAFHNLFEQYSKADSDLRNEWAVRAAGNWQKHSFDQED